MKIKILIVASSVLFLIVSALTVNSWQYSNKIYEIYLKNTFLQNDLSLVIKNKKPLISEYLCKDNSAPYMASNQNVQLPFLDITKARYENNKLFIDNYELAYEGKSVESYLAFLAFENSKTESNKIIPVFLRVGEYTGGMSERGCLLPIKN